MTNRPLNVFDRFRIEKLCACYGVGTIAAEVLRIHRGDPPGLNAHAQMARESGRLDHCRPDQLAALMHELEDVIDA